MDELAIIKTVTAFLGSLGFGMVFNMRPRHLLLAAAGGMFGWIIFYNLEASTGDIFSATL